ncbi:MAG: acylglycerol kinase family protein, partial [Candidatus Acidiferrum sp.]
MELSSLTDSGSPDLVLVNPAAGAGRARAVLPELTKFANQRGWHSEICVTGSPEDLIAKARLAAAAGTERIFVLGGDGTFQLLVNALTAYPETILGVIPAGGGNDVA